jgi:hypothetical protein
MFVSSLTEMEQIVSFRPDLEWDGWNVIHYKKNSSAQFDKKGAYKDGQWYKKTVYAVTENGWSIPNYMRITDDI